MFELLSFMNMYGHSALQFVVPISFIMCQSLCTASIAAKDKEDELKAKKIAVGGTMVVKKDSVFSRNSCSQLKGRSQLNRTATLSFRALFQSVLATPMESCRGARLKREGVRDQIHSTVRPYKDECDSHLSSLASVSSQNKITEQRQINVTVTSAVELPNNHPIRRTTQRH